MTILRTLLISVVLLTAWRTVWAGDHADCVGDVRMPLPKDDSRWEEVAAMWDDHWDGENIDAMLSLVHALETSYPNRIEPCLWLGRLYYLKGRFQKSERRRWHGKAEHYAQKAYAMDNGNLCALFILVHALSSRTDRDMVLDEYGAWLRSVPPLTGGPDLPDLTYSETWRAAMKLFKDRQELEKLEQAVTLFRSWADEAPNDALAQLWAGYACHYLGAYYSYEGRHQDKAVPCFRVSVAYLERSLVIDPHSVPAHYWCQLSMARQVEQATLVTKALYLKPIMDHLLFCIQENALYDSCGPVYITAAMILEGGWVCQKGMAMAGYSVEMVMLCLTIGAILYPDQYFIPYIHAALLDEYKKRPDAAEQMLKGILAKGRPSGNGPEQIEMRVTYDRAQRYLERLITRKATGDDH